MNEIIASRHKQIEMLCEKHRVRRLAVFGSVLREDFDEAKSDIDLLVDFDSQGGRYFELRDELTILFGRKIDLVCWGSLRNPYLRRAIRRSHELLYAA